jgi:Protein of unknown function (DUF2939)
MRTLTKLFAIAALLTLGVWFYFTPHLVLRDMRAAAQTKDAAKLSAHINFPSVKDSVKAKLSTKFAPGTQDGDMPFAGLGAALAGMLINPLVDALVTPESLAVMLTRGEKPKPASPAPTPDAPTAPSAEAPKETETHAAYESFDRFVVTVRRANSSEEPVGFVFAREGVVGWKLSALRLPL